jgi:hypothetical protein
VANSVEKRFNFQVREPFEASFSCERENAQAGLPADPADVAQLQRPVPRKLAEQVRLSSGKDLQATSRNSSGAKATAGQRRSRSRPFFPEQRSFVHEQPQGIPFDCSGRPLRNAEKFPLKRPPGPCRRWQVRRGAGSHRGTHADPRAGRCLPRRCATSSR